MITPDEDRDAVMRGERALAAAHVSLDLSVIDALLHPDYVIAQPDGTTETKAEVLAAYGAGGREWDSAEAGQLDVRLCGDTAVVIGRWRASGRNNGQAFDYEARFLSVWTRQAGVWRNLAYQSIEIID